MVLLVDLAEAGLVDVRVELGGGDVRVAKEFLHDTEVGPAVEEVGGEGVAEGVRMDVVEAGAGGEAFDDLPDGDTVERTAKPGKKEAFLVQVLVPQEFGPAVGEVFADGVEGGLADGDEALLSAFARN